MRIQLVVITFVTLLMLCVSNSYARIWFVKPNGLGDAPTIQAAVDSSVAADSVVLASGVFRGDGNRDIFVNKNVVIRSEGGDPDSCVIDCQGSEFEPHRGFTFMTIGGSVLEGIAITNGNAPTEMYHEIGMFCLGGGIFICMDAAPVISNCTIADNISEHYGGGVYCENSSAIFTQCNFLNNSSGFSGGGMYCSGWFASCSPAIMNCKFTNNSSSYGGGISCDDADPTITSCLFANNAAGSGGGISCKVTWVWSQPHSPVVMNCTFSGNAGGGIYCGDLCSPTLIKSIIAFGVSGKGVECIELSIPSLSCCNVYGNAGGDWVGCIAGQLGIPYGNISVDPLFCDTLNGDYHLDVNSSCLKQGWENLCGQLIGAYGEACGEYTAIEDNDKRSNFSLDQPFPNPFIPQTTITYSIPEAGQVNLTVFDVRGRLIAELVDDYCCEGEHRITWDGSDQKGAKVASGVYFYRIKAGGKTLMKKMVLLK